MSQSRRDFIKFSLGSTVAAAATTMGENSATAEEKGNTDEKLSENLIGCLVDTTLCIGCRQCEQACNEVNALGRPDVPFSDKWILVSKRRRPTADAFTVVNAYDGAPSKVQETSRELTYAKIQCMHCLEPACVSACIVGALRKEPGGPVLYDAYKCIGCRYCMVACPFEIPAYEYDDPITPRVRKCTYCANERNEANPSCAAVCPVEAIVFDKRHKLIELAKARIEANPERYTDHIFGEHEIGGTSWLYLAGRDFTEIGLPSLPDNAPSRLTEAIQHGIFKYGAFPILLYSGLGALMWLNSRKKEEHEPNADGSGKGADVSKNGGKK